MKLFILKTPNNSLEDETFLFFRNLLTDTGAIMIPVEGKAYRLEGNQEVCVLIEELFEICRQGFWGNNIKAMVETTTLVGPFDLIEERF